MRRSGKGAPASGKLAPKEVRKLFGEMRQAVLANDIEGRDRLYRTAGRARLDFTFASKEKITFKNDNGLEFTELVRHVTLTLGGVRVARWEEEYWGYYGGMGAGWFVEKHDSTSGPGIEELLIAYGLELPDLDVPKPVGQDLAGRLFRLVAKPGEVTTHPLRRCDSGVAG